MAGNIVKWWKHKILGGYKQFSGKKMHTHTFIYIYGQSHSVFFFMNQKYTVEIPAKHILLSAHLVWSSFDCILCQIHSQSFIINEVNECRECKSIWEIRSTWLDFKNQSNQYKIVLIWTFANLRQTATATLYSPKKKTTTTQHLKAFSAQNKTKQSKATKMRFFFSVSFANCFYSDLLWNTQISSRSNNGSRRHSSSSTEIIPLK